MRSSVTATMLFGAALAGGCTEGLGIGARPWTVAVYTGNGTSDFMVRGYTPDYGPEDWHDTGQELEVGARVGCGLQKGRAIFHFEAGLESSVGQYPGKTPGLLVDPVDHRRLATYLGMRAAFAVSDWLQAYVSAGYESFQSELDEPNPSPARTASAYGSGPSIGIGFSFALNRRADMTLEYRHCSLEGTWRATDGYDYPFEESMYALQIGLAMHFPRRSEEESSLASGRAELARKEALARQEEAERLREEARLKALADRQEARRLAAERRAERRAGMRPGVFGMRAGMLLPASAEGVEFGQSMLLGLGYRLPERHDAGVSSELTVDFGWPEEAGAYESRPVVVGLNLLVPPGKTTGAVQAHAVAGLGVVCESVRELATGDESVNGTAVLRLGGGAVFAGGHVGARLTCLLSPGSRNLAGRACFTVVCDF